MEPITLPRYFPQKTKKKGTDNEIDISLSAKKIKNMLNSSCLNIFTSLPCNMYWFM